MMLNDKITKSTGLSKKKITAVALVAILLIIIFSVIGCVNHFLGKINRETDDELLTQEEFFETDVYNENLEELAPEDVEWNNSELYDDSKLVNILVVGQDGRDAEGRTRTDTMILLSFNPETNEASMISFLRDLYVQIPGRSDNRLNSAYVFGGFSLLKNTFKANFDINIDGCVKIDFEGFEDVIDILGGVDIELTAAEAKIIGDGAHEGVSHLDGDHALMYARIRKLDSDFGRTQRQRNIVTAVFNKVKKSSVSDLLKLVDTVLPYISTDMSNAQIAKLAVKYAPSLASLKISTYSVPADGTYQNAMIRGMAVLVPDLYKIKQLLFEEYMPFN